MSLKRSFNRLARPKAKASCELRSAPILRNSGTRQLRRSTRSHKWLGLSRLRPQRWGLSILVSLLIVVMHTVSFAATPVEERSIDWLSNGQHLRTTQFLFADEPILATCSQDCYNVEMTLRDGQTHAIVAQTRQAGKEQSLHAPYEGAFQVDVTMRNCARASGCRTWIYLEDDIE